MSRKRIHGLEVDDITHPSDSNGLKVTKYIPGFKLLLDKTVGEYQRKVSDITYTGNGYEVNGLSLPRVRKQLEADCAVIGLSDVPDLTITQGYFISSESNGGKKKRIVLTSGCVDLLTPKELDFIIGHELGHIVSGHQPYHALVETLYSPVINNSNTSLDWASVVKLPLLEWYRLSHYTADRVGLLCCQDINVALSAMIKMAGLPKKYYERIDIPAFLEQVRNFDAGLDNIDKAIKFISIRSANSPWMVQRAKELLDWYESGEYHRIVS